MLLALNANVSMSWEDMELKVHTLPNMLLALTPKIVTAGKDTRWSPRSCPSEIPSTSISAKAYTPGNNT